MELMIVITIICIMFGVVGYPYQYYMDRIRVENTLDSISQTWIESHKAVRNGLIVNENHAQLEFTFEQGSGQILIQSTNSGGTGTGVYKILPFEKNIIILGFTGSIDSTNIVKYRIAPVTATGSFSTGSTGKYQSLDNVSMIIGYSGARLGTGRARQIYLRPYYD